MEMYVCAWGQWDFMDPRALLHSTSSNCVGPGPAREVPHADYQVMLD